MRYMDFLMLFMMISLSLSAVNNLNFIPSAADYANKSIEKGTTLEQTEGGEVVANNESFVGKVKQKMDSSYSGRSVEGSDTSYRASNDFLTSASIFIDIFAEGTIFVGQTYDQFIPSKHPGYALKALIVPTIYFLYMVGFFQILSGRNFKYQT